jgi:energy-coupling factor transport system ATP-binding protein
LIITENLRFAYFNGPEVLKGINLSIEDGEFVAIMGENGAGKTTLIKTFNGLLRPTSGRVLVDGVDTTRESVASLARRVGVVFQNPDHQLFAETVKEELSFSLRNFGYDEATIERRVLTILKTLDLVRYIDSSPFVLSGGERKRLALASVLVWNPNHLVMDEPTIGQDYDQKDRLRNFIIQLNTQGKTVVIVTHDIEFVAECKPRVVLLSKGRIIADGKAEDVLTDKQVLSDASLVKPQIAKLADALNRPGLLEKTIDVYSARNLLSHLLRGER